MEERISYVKGLYLKIITEVSTLLENLDLEYIDPEVEKGKLIAKNKLTIIQEELNDSLISLEKNSEWEYFTIAFYGETNAGKSTLIETLRILLGESLKVKQRDEYEKYLVEYTQLNDNKKRKLEEIDRVKNQEKLYRLEKLMNIELLKSRKDSINIDITEKQFITYLHNNKVFKNILSSNINLLKAMLGKLDDFENKIKLSKSLSYLKKNVDALENLIIDEKNEENTYEDDLHNLEAQRIFMDEKLDVLDKQLSQLQDGEIVGNGRSDFTQTVSDYYFENGTEKFMLLDLPGIEGNEQIVQNEIYTALQRAHAVFYISSKATPPQKGSDEKTGTIAKIRKQLSSLTEVYFIYNKRVRNYRQLTSPLINDEEEKSLNTVDKILSEELNDNYSNHYSLSAFPALLSKANLWDSRLLRTKQKFEDKFRNEQILEYSMIRDFSNWIINNLVKEVKGKIVKSNIFKINQLLSSTIYSLEEIIENNREIENDLLTYKEKLKEEIKNEVKNFRSLMENSLRANIQKFKINSREEIYTKIDAVLDKESFVKDSQHTLDKAKDTLLEKLKIESEKNTNSFKQSLNDIVIKYQKRSDELIRNYLRTENLDFDFDISSSLVFPDDKKNKKIGKTILAATTGIVGVTLAIIFPVGWVALSLTILGSLFTFYKEIRGYFDKNYRSARQKSIFDKQLSKVIKDMETQIETEFDEYISGIEKELEPITDATQNSIDQIIAMKSVFEMSKNELTRLQSTII